MYNKLLHISIDDVMRAFQRCEERDYQSIYDVKFFRYLRVLHRMSGMKITLYTFEKEGDWSLEKVPNKYKSGFEDASEWLKFGFHAVSKDQAADNVLSEFEKAYDKYDTEVKRFAGQNSIAKILRLHYWFYPEEYIKVLRQNGISTLLVKEGQAVGSSEIQTWETNVRIENDTFKSILYKIFHHSKEKPLVIFTHEWALNRRNKIKLLIVVIMTRLLGYKFICE